MFDKLAILRMAGNLAAHASARQGVVAENVANADTPGYRARDLASFGEAYRDEAEMPMRATRPEHMLGRVAPQRAETIDAPDQESPNGNSVSLEEQMVKAADLRNQHDTALAVYSATLGILRTSLGGR